MRLVIQRIWISPLQRFLYRLLIYGDQQAQRDFASLNLLLQVLRQASVPVVISEGEVPQGSGSCVLVSQSVQLDAEQLSVLALNSV
ncbi:MAG TPA: hypothetical protein VKW78_01620 [Terriglobales bacterium]|nr:hypothetical protein [Terriglobales bacterium]